jgi:radical SAM-linked protein
MQRLRIRFYRGEEIKFISHLDIMRLWQRAFNRAGVTLAYSEGFNPHPRLSLAAPLALGVTSEAELMDIVLDKWMSPHYFTSAVGSQMPPGIGIMQTSSVPLTLPSLQSVISYAEYKVGLENEAASSQVGTAIESLLAADTLPWQHQRDTGTRHYDLRPLIDDLWLMEQGETSCTLGMRLRCGSSGSGRPEQVAKALGFDQYPQSIHRTKLILNVK